jgi:hypothetical protein
LLQLLRNEWEAQQFVLDRVYGAAAAWEKRMDRAVLSQVQRLPAPGVQSSFCGLDTLLGRDEKITFEDYLNGAYLPAQRP